MCKCNPSSRTPFCGRPGCEWPEQIEMRKKKLWRIIMLNEDCYYRVKVKRTDQDSFPCAHGMNAKGLCAIMWCPIEESTINEKE